MGSGQGLFREPQMDTEGTQMRWRGQKRGRPARLVCTAFHNDPSSTDPAHEETRLQPEHDGRVRCSRLHIRYLWKHPREQAKSSPDNHEQPLTTDCHLKRCSVLPAVHCKNAKSAKERRHKESIPAASHHILSKHRQPLHQIVRLDMDPLRNNAQREKTIDCNKEHRSRRCRRGDYEANIQCRTLHSRLTVLLARNSPSYAPSGPAGRAPG